MQEQEELRIEIEREKKAKQQAEELNTELGALCSNLRHKALAYIIGRAKEARLTREAQALSAKLAADVSQGEA